MRSQQGRLREERRLIWNRILASAREAGFASAGFVGPSRLVRWSASAAALSDRGFFRHEELSSMELQWLLYPLQWAASESILVCACRFDSGGPHDLSQPGDPHALIAPFARANYYKKAAGMMRRALRLISDSTSIDTGSARIFSNSRIPEKPMLAATGLAAYGKNSLCLVDGLGSSFIIAGAVLPIPTAELGCEAAPAQDPCGGCTLCMDACPVGAIVEPGVVDPSRCLQGLASRPIMLEAAVMEAWGVRLYGCETCQSACPHNSRVGALADSEPAAPGLIGPSLSLRGLLSLDRIGWKDLLRGTAMGMSWIAVEALLRNALVAAGNRGDHSLSRLIAGHLSDASPMIRDTARWALARTSSG